MAGGVGMIMYENSNAGNLFSDTHWVPSVHVDQTPGLAIKAYIAANPGTATARIVAQQLSEWAFAPSMTDFSSRGPNAVAADVIKPDVTAPGIQVLAGGSPFPDPGTTPPGELYQAIAGTSMSSPHVAGLFALLKQANPDWSAAVAKSALMTTAHQNVLNNDRTSAATPFDMGAGHVQPGRPNQKGSSFQPGLAYDAGFPEYLGFLCDAFPAALANPAATCASLESAGVPTKAVDLNLASIGISQVPGSETVTRTVTSVAKENGNRTYQASVTAPPGYTVAVSPSSFTLKSGESATFEVTVTNVSAPLGQWRFGSLTWRDQTGNYSAYSPIAVRGALFSAPAGEVTSNGSPTSYQVRFGYTGPFTASARGLVPAAVTSDTVSDDSTNGNCGLAAPNAELIDVVVPAGTTFARFQLFAADADPNSDMDMCVFRGSTLVGSSLSNDVRRDRQPAESNTGDVHRRRARLGGWGWFAIQTPRLGARVDRCREHDGQCAVVGDDRHGRNHQPDVLRAHAWTEVPRIGGVQRRCRTAESDDRACEPVTHDRSELARGRREPAPRSCARSRLRRRARTAPQA